MSRIPLAMVDVTFLLLAFFVGAGIWPALGGSVDAALPKDLTGCWCPWTVERLNLLAFVEEPGTLQRYGSGWRHEGRKLRYEIGQHRWNDLRGVERFLAARSRPDHRVSLDPRKGVTTQEALDMLQLARRLGWRDATFGGTFEGS